MLSYRHAYHAGNFADVLKHIVLIDILEHLTKKPKPFDVIDTHAGAGRYDLNAAASQLNAEHKTGIASLKPEDFPELEPYFAAIQRENETAPGQRCYPGSPALVAHYLRPGDRAWWFELHPNDFTALRQLDGRRQVRVAQEDGFAGLRRLVPPASRRGLVLIDPSYEIKDDYQKVFTEVQAAHKKWPTGTYAIWYPVVERHRINELERQFKTSGIRNIQLFELGVQPDHSDKGMTAAGMIVINPPYTLNTKMAALLPRLSAAISSSSAEYVSLNRRIEIAAE